ncbi:MAG TPA: hypothetical protein VD867_18650, partial [Burkholderiales bacterium]|nr:hypothetical protein [Burkholderiales bacterium]
MDARTADRTPDTTAVGVMGLDVPPGPHPLTMSPINRRRWQNFKKNRRGFWSLWIFLVLFGLSLFAEFISNDRPIVISYKGEILLPIFNNYPESKFGGFL